MRYKIKTIFFILLNSLYFIALSTDAFKAYVSIQNSNYITIFLLSFNLFIGTNIINYYFKNWIEKIRIKKSKSDIICVLFHLLRNSKNIIISTYILSTLYLIYSILNLKILKNQLILEKSISIQYGYIILLIVIFFVLFKSLNCYKKEKINYYENIKKKQSDDAEVLKIKSKINILHVSFRILNVFLLICILLLIINKTGISWTKIFAFSSVFIVVLGMSARTFLANLFGGFMISFYRPFKIGDKIKINDKSIEGIVTYIGWLSVTVKNSHKNTTHIPNSLFNGSHIDNLSEKFGNKFEEYYKISDINDLEKVKLSIKNIKKILEEHSGIDNDEGVIVSITEFNGNYFKLKISCTTFPTSEIRFSSIKHDLLLKINDLFVNNEIELYKQKCYHE